MCSRFNPHRDEVQIILKQKILPELLVEAMLSSKVAWNVISTFATEVLTDLRSIEKDEGMTLIRKKAKIIP